MPDKDDLGSAKKGAPQRYTELVCWLRWRPPSAWDEHPSPHPRARRDEIRGRKCPPGPRHFGAESRAITHPHCPWSTTAEPRSSRSPQLPRSRGISPVSRLKVGRPRGRSRSPGGEGSAGVAEARSSSRQPHCPGAEAARPSNQRSAARRRFAFSPPFPARISLPQRAGVQMRQLRAAWRDERERRAPRGNVPLRTRDAAQNGLEQEKRRRGKNNCRKESPVRPVWSQHGARGLRVAEAMSPRPGRGSSCWRERPRSAARKPSGRGKGGHCRAGSERAAQSSRCTEGASASLSEQDCSVR